MVHSESFHFSKFLVIYAILVFPSLLFGTVSW